MTELLRVEETFVANESNVLISKQKFDLDPSPITLQHFKMVDFFVPKHVPSPWKWKTQHSDFITTFFERNSDFETKSYESTFRPYYPEFHSLFLHASWKYTDVYLLMEQKRK